MVGRHSKKARGQSRRYARKPSVWSEIRGYLLTVIAVMLVVLLGRTFVFTVYVIPSRSMEDTLQIGDRVFASRLTPRLFTLHRGDIIVFKDPADWMEGEQLPTNLMSIIDSNRYLIKRVIGLPGDTVACKGSGEPITVNGKPIDESAYLKSGVNPSDSPFSVTVTDGNVFVLRDDRSNSRDSRYHLDDGNNGLVPYDDIQGVALFRFWPFTRIGILN
ncbi:signal peptidase I [Bifidobacterium longum]|nr:signal peptidase I [Bifidobacterium longum]